MSFSDCEIKYDAPAVLHETVQVSRIYSRGGPIDQGTLAGMVRQMMALPQQRASEANITVDGWAVGGEKTWLELEQVREIFARSDFPK